MQNFGKIHETFKNIFVDGVVEKRAKDKAIIKSYIKILKENKILKTQFQIFDKLENKIYEDVDSSSMFVDECIFILNKLGKRNINEVNTKIVKFLTKNGYDLSSGYAFASLHEHITNLAFSVRNSSNIKSIVESKIFLNKFTNKVIINENSFIEPYANNFLGPAMVEKFNEKYVDLLSESEKDIFKLVTNSDSNGKMEFYQNNVTECVDLLNLKLNEDCTIEEKDKYLRVKDKLLRYKYNEDTFISEITKITSLKKTLK